MTMKNVIPLPIDDDDNLVEPPIVDFLYHDPDRHAFIVTFVPEDSVSASEKEGAEIPDRGSDGLRIGRQLKMLAQRLNCSKPIERIMHGGGGDFEFRLKGGEIIKLSGDSPDGHASMSAYGILQDIAMIAQVVFIEQERLCRAAGVA